MKIVASIQVRMGSERLPGKVMRVIAGKPMLWYLAHRLKQTTTLDELVIATPQSRSNDVIADFCLANDIKCFRGAEDDVLDRLLQSLKACGADVGVVVFGDNPLVDPRIIDEFVELFLVGEEVDWLGNDLKTTFPPGMEVEVFTCEALEDSAVRFKDPKTREHGTLAIRQNPDLYRLRNIEAQEYRRRPDLYLGVDTPIDLDVVKSIVEYFGDDTSFSLEDIIKFLDENPGISKKNGKVHRRWRKYRA